MAIKSYENVMEGTSWEITFDTPMVDFPLEVSSILTAAESKAFCNMDAYLKEMLSKSSIKGLSNFIECLQNAKSTILEYHTSEYIDNKVMFRFDLDNGISPAISLPTCKEETNCPEALEQMYSIIGSTKHEEWEMNGGIYSHKDICSIADMDVWLDEESNDYPPEEAFVFYANSYGDNLSFNKNGKVLSYQHEGGYLAEWGGLEKFIRKYFEQLTQGKFLNCDIEE